MKIQAIRGTKDILPVDAAQFQKLEAVTRDVMARFGFSEIRTPTFEALELFQRSMGETTDVVQKEMYVLEDRGGRKLALRPEGTAGVVRAFIEHHLSQTMPFSKLFYIAPMFRAERPQAGRYREFWQAGAEYFGNASPFADAEILLLVTALFKALGVQDASLNLNHLGDAASRAAYRAALLAYLEKRAGDLSEETRARMHQNPLRALDSKVDGPKLGDAPTVDQHWSAESRAHFDQVQNLLTQQGCRFTFSPRLVRGLDYYNGTVFELTSHALGAQNALAGGGRYDSLVKEMDGPDMPAIGFALGIERTLEVLKALGGEAASASKPLVFVASQGPAGSAAFALLERLRRELDDFRIEGGFFHKKLGAQLGLADRLGAGHCLILGEEEAAQGEVTIRHLKSGRQERVSIDGAVDALRRVVDSI